MGDPAARDLSSKSGVAQSARRTLNSLLSKGRGAFGVQTERALRFPADYHSATPPTVAADPDEAPGPLSYSPQQTAIGREQNMVMRNGTETMPSATFASKVPRISNPMPKCQEDLPGPGYYDPDDAAVRESLPTASVSKVGRASRYTGDSVLGSHATDENVGPGSYSPGTMNDGTRSTISAHVQDKAAGSQDASFSSTANRDVFNWFLDEIGNFGQWWSSSR